MLKTKEKSSLTDGPIFTRLLTYVLPIILTGILQVAYNMADNVVVGRYSGDPNALGSVGSTATFATLIVNLLIAFASGAGVVIAQFYGAKNDREVSRTVHTTMAISIIGGFGLMALSFALAIPILNFMGTQEVFFDGALLYMRIICIGIPASSIYNFGASVLRSVGDSKTSLYILSASGLVNVGLNLVFVCLFGMSVDGVALATIISQYLSAIAVVVVLMKRRGTSYQLSLKKLCLEGRLVKRIMRIAIPIAVQTTLFSISNMVIMMAVNTFPPAVVSAKTIAFNVEGITYTTMNSYQTAAMTFVGQNWGAQKYRRINKVALYAVLQVAALGILISQIEIFFGAELSSMYIEPGDPNKAAIVEAVLDIFAIMLATYFLCGIMETLSGVLKGLGYSTISMIACLIGLAVRVFWILVVTPTERFHTIFGLFVAYTISWLVTIALLVGCILYVWHKLGILKRARLEKLNENENIKENIKV